MFKRAVFVFLFVIVALAVRAQTQFVYDSFTGPNGTLLESHSPDVGGAWTRVRGGGIELISNTARPDRNQFDDLYTNAAAAPSADYVVGISVTFAGNNTDNVVELYARVTGTNGYGIALDALGNYAILRYVGGVPTVLASGTTTALQPRGTLNEIVFSVTDASKRLIVNGTVVATTTDNTVTTAGITGFGLRTKTPNDAIGDNFYASTLGPTAVKMDSMRAVRDDERVLLSWTTGREAGNLGYRIWRETGRQRVLLTPAPIAGSAFFVNAQSLGSGNAYRWLDAKSSRRGSRYWIEELDVHGAREWHGPIVPHDGPIDDTLVPAPTLGQLAQRSGVVKVSHGLEALRASDATNFDLARREAMKIAVTTAGIHEVRLADLPAGIDAKRLQLWADGAEVPFFATRNAIRFYGSPLDTAASGTRVYWLTWDRGPSPRTDTKSQGTLPLHTASGFLATVERRDKIIFDATLQSEDGDGFFGPLVTNDATWPARQTLRLDHVDRTAANAELTLTLQGATAGMHRAGITVNGHAAGTIEFEGQAKRRATLTVPVASLRDGDNDIVLVAQNGAEDVSALEAVRIVYSRKYAAAEGTLLFTAPGGTRVPVSGLTGDVVALDITEPHAPVALTVAGGTIAVRGAGQRTVIASTRMLRPSLEANVPSTLHKARGDVVMLAPRSFFAALAPLASRRGSVILAAIEDVYDECSFGAKDPAAIRAFLAAVQPRAVLLAGDGSYDPRNYVGGGATDVIPVQLVPSAQQRTPSDAWYTDFNHDGIADIAIGRLPARTAAELQTMVAKILAYEDAPVAANDVVIVNGAGFAQQAAHATDGVNVDAEGLVAARQNLLQRWSNGASLIHFFGHGSVEIWQSESFFSRADAASLTNSRLPLVTAMTCLNGYFHDLAQESLAETLLRNPNGGAAGVWALSTLTEPDAQLVAHDALVASLLAGQTLGEATLAAQRATTDPDVRRTLLLFGDPMMRKR